MPCFQSQVTWRVGGSRWRGFMYTYSRFTSLYSRNQHSIVKQVYTNKKKEYGKKKKPNECGPPGPFPNYSIHCRNTVIPTIEKTKVNQGQPCCATLSLHPHGRAVTSSQGTAQGRCSGAGIEGGPATTLWPLPRTQSDCMKSFQTFNNRLLYCCDKNETCGELTDFWLEIKMLKISQKL